MHMHACMTNGSPETSSEQGVLIPLLTTLDTKVQIACPSFHRQQPSIEHPINSFIAQKKDSLIQNGA